MPDAGIQKPDTESMLATLKPFQRDTVEYVFRRMYTDPDCTRRFLVADEVGLGKTMVARGVIARAIDHLQGQVDRVDVVYICSNADIAGVRGRSKNLTIHPVHRRYGEQLRFHIDACASSASE